MTREAGEAKALAASRYATTDADRWDEFVGAAADGTFLHTRRYLGYHRDRFDDLSVLVHSPNGALIAVLPAARRAGEQTSKAVSHPGITYGGLLYGSSLRGEGLVEAMRVALSTLHSLGIDELDYRPVPAFARRQLGDEDRYALFRLGAERSSCNLGAVVDLARRPAVDAKKRNMLRKAERSDLALHDGLELLPSFWNILTEQLSRRYAAAPVHSANEITELTQLFPEQIGLRVATMGDGEVVAGALTYRYTTDVIHTQYLASNDAGRQRAALDLVCESILDEASAAGKRYVSFGTSNDDDGRVLNDSLYRFKHSFGAMGVAIESYRVPCRAP